MDAVEFLGILSGLHKGKGSKMTNTPKYLRPQELAERWQQAVTVGTLANWRVKGKGPEFSKFGTKVLYPIGSVEKWEREQLRAVNDNTEAIRKKA